MLAFVSSDLKTKKAYCISGSVLEDRFIPLCCVPGIGVNWSVMVRSFYFGSWNSELRLTSCFNNIPFVGWKSQMYASIVVVSIDSPHLHITAHFLIVCV